MIQPELLPPGSLPMDTDKALTYLHDLVRSQHTVLVMFLESFYRELNVEPDKPREGVIVFADGTNWNPGSGRGLYQYVSGSWAKI